MANKPPLDLSKLDVPETGGGSFVHSDTTDVEKTIRRIKGLLVGDDYHYAEDTLRGILATIERTRRVSEGQARAVENIADRPHNDQPHRSRWGRGW